MKLCHGTSLINLDGIMRDGLIPRGNRKSNWGAESNEHSVYLTKTYGLHFATNARKSKDEGIALIEIDTDLLPAATRLLPDEDALWFAWRAGVMQDHEVEDYVHSLAQDEQARWFAGFLDEFAERGFTWEWSLNTIGNCTHLGEIPTEAITRIVTYDAKDGWWFAFHDPQVAPSNYKFCGSEYEATQLVALSRLDEALKVQHMWPISFSLEQVELLCAQHRTATLTPDDPSMSHVRSSILSRKP